MAQVQSTPLTMQQIFDRAVSGVMRQGKLAHAPCTGVCRYRATVSGTVLACGVGHLIDDDLYDVRCEGVGVHYATPSRARVAKDDALMLSLLFSGVDVTDPEVVALLGDIQGAHDNANDLAWFNSRCHELATDYALTFPA